MAGGTRSPGAADTRLPARDWDPAQGKNIGNRHGLGVVPRLRATVRSGFLAKGTVVDHGSRHYHVLAFSADTPEEVTDYGQSGWVALKVGCKFRQRYRLCGQGGDEDHQADSSLV